MNKALFATIGFACLVIAAGTASAFSLSSSNTKSGKKNLTLASADDFETQTAKMNQCYLTSTTDCDGTDMSDYYWSEDPDKYWESVNNSYNDSNTWSAPAPEVTAPLPSQPLQNTTYATPQAQTQPVYQYNTGTLLPEDSPTATTGQQAPTKKGKDSSSQGSFIIS
jgi:hypothetical protein